MSLGSLPLLPRNARILYLMCQIIYTNLLNRNIESVQLLDSAEMKSVVILSLLAKMIMNRVLRLF